MKPFPLCETSFPILSRVYQSKVLLIEPLFIGEIRELNLESLRFYLLNSKNFIP